MSVSFAFFLTKIYLLLIRYNKNKLQENRNSDRIIETTNHKRRFDTTFNLNPINS